MKLSWQQESARSRTSARHCAPWSTCCARWGCRRRCYAQCRRAPSCSARGAAMRRHAPAPCAERRAPPHEIGRSAHRPGE
eukprot:5618976-Prymnesium_polylepis.1